MSNAPKPRAQPNAELLAGVEPAPTIHIDGKDWPIPPFNFETSANCTPLIVKLGAETKRLAQDPLALTTPLVLEFGTMVFTAMHQGHTDLTREQFNQMRITVPDLIATLNVLRRQAGLFRERTPEDGAAGETKGSSQTGAP